jgi:hypothetical protein
MVGSLTLVLVTVLSSPFAARGAAGGRAGASVVWSTVTEEFSGPEIHAG